MNVTQRLVAVAVAVASTVAAVALLASACGTSVPPVPDEDASVGADAGGIGSFADVTVSQPDVVLVGDADAKPGADSISGQVEDGCKSDDDCAALAHQCVTAICDLVSQTCQVTAVADGTGCDPGGTCLTGSTCQAGVCEGALSKDCNDGNPCTDDSCDEDSGCINALRTGACDDGDICTTNDECIGTQCLGTGSLDCDDDNPCTADGCDDVLGCVHEPIEGPCDDGNACTWADKCVVGACKGQFIACDDGDPCTSDGCDPQIGCVATPKDGPGCGPPPGAVCGNGQCEAGESCPTCPSDCKCDASTCGDGTCQPAESCATCPSDCPCNPNSCGNGVCEAGETCASCPSDCKCEPTGGLCGDGVCEEGGDSAT